MPIPDYQAIMLPLLKFAADKEEHSLRESVDILADKFSLTNLERKELLPSGTEGRFYNRVSWARTYLKKAELLHYPRRGCFAITLRGVQLLSSEPQEINAKFLERYEEFVQFVEVKHNSKLAKTIESKVVETPEEILEAAHQRIQEKLSKEILENILKINGLTIMYVK